MTNNHPVAYLPRGVRNDRPWRAVKGCPMQGRARLTGGQRLEERQQPTRTLIQRG